jgi:AraC family transcriptional activator FtrA
MSRVRADIQTGTRLRTSGVPKAAVLALPNVVPFDVTAACQILGTRLPTTGAPYEVIVCAESPGLVATQCGFALQVDAGLEAITDADLVVVAGTLPADPVPDPAVVDALRAAHGRGAPMVAIGTAAFVLARAGLLNGRRATTHWWHARELARRFPRVRVNPDVLVVEDGGIYTSAGLAAAIDLCLEVVRRDHGAAIANEAARYAVVAAHRPGSQAQRVDRPAPADQDRGLAEVRGWMLRHLDGHITLDELATRAYMSRRQFTRTFRTETGTSPWQWLLAQRLAEARRMLAETHEPIETVARRCGFATPAAFRVKFKEVVGELPSRYRERMRTAPAAARVVDLFAGRRAAGRPIGAIRYSLSS